MRYSTEKEIMLYPDARPTGRTMTVDGVLLNDYRVLDRNVWRTYDQFSIEVGRHGAGNATWYCKVRGMILEHNYASAHSAAQAGVKMLAAYTKRFPTAFGI